MTVRCLDGCAVKMKTTSNRPSPRLKLGAVVLKGAGQHAGHCRVVLESGASRIVLLTREKVSAKAQIAQRKPQRSKTLCVFLCAFAPLREFFPKFCALIIFFSASLSAQANTRVTISMPTR